MDAKYPIRMPKYLRLLNLFLGIALLSFSLYATAQTAGTASLQGAVSDPTGAVVPGASVTITNMATGTSHSAVTGSNGLYSFPNLDIGTYRVDVVVKGFVHYRRSNIVLEVGSSIAVNVSLPLGESQQEVDVHASSLALQTEDSSFKQTIDQKTLTELPLNGRQVTSLITLAGGSANANANNDLASSKNFYSSVVVSIAGGQGNATDYRLDGGDHNDWMTNINLPFPFPDAVAQFSVETTALGSQSGLHPGGLVNVVTRSGANQWHGSAFEFIRNNFIDATNFFSTSKDSLHQNQFGGTFGGRIIPDKLFFFAGYQRLHSSQSQANTTAYVPTAANLAGDFSITDGPVCQKTPIQLLNPQTGEVLPGNHINPSLFAAPALALQKYFPATTDPCGLVSYAIPSQLSENQFVTRIDWTINSKNTLYGRYFLDGYQSPSFFSPTNIFLANSTGNYERVQSLTLGENYFITSNLVNTVHLTATRRRDNRGPGPDANVNAGVLGINITSLIDINAHFKATNKWSVSGGPLAVFNVNAFAVADDVNWVHGKHLIGFGGEFLRSQFNQNNTNEQRGYFTFSGIYGQKGPSGASAGGTGQDSNLDFLAGAMSGFQQSQAQQAALRAPVPSLYIQDTYHATKKLVLSAGVRWSPEFWPVDVFRRGSVFDMNAFLGNSVSKVYPNAPAGSLYYGDSGVPRGFTKNSPWQFEPRIGVTFDPLGTGTTVFRAGAAMVYDTPNMFSGQMTLYNAPFSVDFVNTPVNVPLSLANPWSNGTITNNPFPRPTVPTHDATFENGSQFYVLPQHFHPPYTLQWTASMQHQFGRDWQFQIDYIASQTRFNPYGHPINPAVYIPGTCGANPCSTTGNTASRYALTLANPSQGPKYAGGQGTVLMTSGVNASYNGMIASIQHRLSSNFVFLANYTWSRCIDIEENPGDIAGVSEQDPNNLKGDRGSCGFDFTDVFNTAFVATSHFHFTGWKSLTLNNWRLSPIMKITNGTPFTVVSGVDNSLTDIGNDRPNLVNSSGLYTGKKIMSGNSANAQYINASAFAVNPAGTFGDAGRNAFRGPKFFQLDTALSRIFPLHDRLALDLRLEAFNVLNHPDFATPNASGFEGSSASLASSTFGRVTATVNGYGARIFQGAIKLNF